MYCFIQVFMVKTFGNSFLFFFFVPPLSTFSLLKIEPRALHTLGRHCAPWSHNGCAVNKINLHPPAWLAGSPIPQPGNHYFICSFHDLSCFRVRVRTGDPCHSVPGSCHLAECPPGLSLWHLSKFLFSLIENRFFFHTIFSDYIVPLWYHSL